MCQHRPPCPAADQPDRDAAIPLARDDVTGWTRLCNGVIRFDDTGDLLPDNSIVAPCRPLATAGAAP
ncbi:hypothetical protein GCM10010277_79230 [Streptomyces longisporoflavus]|uniref:DUF5999 family protein n=1 Tax=Streptomyces longisporoflavus TaxID=28044 RepID=UPI00167EF3BF|nr:DUF5999 family protein [Streptomyces longisporoflavus]GGV69213.1 hypothetical protein GCM10010277_79230 [Streptomyces longisporoflavus]